MSFQSTDIIGVLKRVYPVGCIYTSTNSTDPSTSLGFGTWSAFGAGRVPVGYDSGQTEFDTDEETGGAKTVTLTAAESGLPAHTHPNVVYSGSSTVGLNAGAVTGVALTYAGTGNIPLTVAANSSAAASSAHNNLQPYIVVRMWKRTA